jgi:DNA-binding response OmpR family regulator
MAQTILVVDDEAMVTEVVWKYLRRERFEVVATAGGQAALDAAHEHNPDLVIFDLMLLLIVGVEVCRRLRAGSQVPVIMLTARGEELDRIIGLELGADDYLTKPFSARELVARVKAVLRRATATSKAAGDQVNFADMSIDPAGCVPRSNPTQRGHRPSRPCGALVTSLKPDSGEDGKAMARRGPVSWLLLI